MKAKQDSYMMQAGQIVVKGVRLSAMLQLLALAMLTATSLRADSFDDVLNSCFAAVEEGNTDAITTLTNEIKRWRFLSSQTVVERAERCLTDGLGSTWQYDLSNAGFVDVGLRQQNLLDEQLLQEQLRQRRCEIREDIRKTEAQLAGKELIVAEYQNELERVRLDRSKEVDQLTAIECNLWADEDVRAALTNPICNAVLRQIGMPNSDVVSFSGPSERDYIAAQMEILRLNLSLQAASKDLDIIEAEGMLPEDYREFTMELTRDVSPLRLEDECQS